MPRATLKRILKLGLAVVVLTAMAWHVYAARQQAPTALVRVAFLDVGQGDSELILLPRHYQILIDGGPGQDVVDQLSLTMPVADRTIELVILTHPDADHLAGLLSVLTEYEVKYVLMPDVSKETRMYKEWMELIDAQQIPYQFLREPQTMMLGDEITLTTLHPSAATNLSKMAANDWSIVMRLDIKNVSLLFTGDIEREIEAELVQHYPMQLDADVLKVPHHGSKTSSTEAFLQAVSPEFAVMSLGKDNRYGHPHKEVMQRYDKLAVPLWRTDEQGMLMLGTDGQEIWRETPVFAAMPLFGKNYEKVYTFQQR